jgi:hypothetical protein
MEEDEDDERLRACQAFLDRVREETARLNGKGTATQSSTLFGKGAQEQEQSARAAQQAQGAVDIEPVRNESGGISGVEIYRAAPVSGRQVRELYTVGDAVQVTWDVKRSTNVSEAVIESFFEDASSGEIYFELRWLMSLDAAKLRALKFVRGQNREAVEEQFKRLADQCLAEQDSLRVLDLGPTWGVPTPGRVTAPVPYEEWVDMKKQHKEQHHAVFNAGRLQCHITLVATYTDSASTASASAGVHEEASEAAAPVDVSGKEPIDEVGTIAPCVFRPPLWTHGSEWQRRPYLALAASK